MNKQILLLLVLLIAASFFLLASQPSNSRPAASGWKGDAYYIEHALAALELAKDPATSLTCNRLNVETGERNCTQYNDDIEDYAPFMLYFNHSNFSIPAQPSGVFYNSSTDTFEVPPLGVEFNCDFWTGWAHLGKPAPVKLEVTQHPYVLGCTVDYELSLGRYDEARQLADELVSQVPQYGLWVADEETNSPLGKTFTEAAYGLMMAYEQFRNESYKQAFYRMYESFQARKSGVCYLQYLNGTETLFIGNTMIELDIDAYNLFGNESFKEDAFRCVRNLLPLRQQNGLIPYIIGENPMTRTEMDAENDFVVVLRKFCYRFGEYCSESEQQKHANMLAFEAPYGYYEQLGQTNVETKYFGAMLKMWMPVNDSYLTRDR